MRRSALRGGGVKLLIPGPYSSSYVFKMLILEEKMLFKLFIHENMHDKIICVVAFIVVFPLKRFLDVLCC